jgi:tetratricopeptide (TPR) repeat protein
VGKERSVNANAKRKRLIGLRRVLVDRFSDGELRSLCFDLDVDYESLPGKGKADKARELIAHMDRRESIVLLIEAIEGMRPDISWEDAAAPRRLSAGAQMRRLPIWARGALGAIFVLLLACVVLMLTGLLPGLWNREDRDRVVNYRATVTANHRLAIDDIANQEYDAAEDKLEAARRAADKTDPLDPEALAQRGYIALALAQVALARNDKTGETTYLAEASRWFEGATRVDPDNASAQNGLGTVFYAQGDLDASIAAYLRAIELHPTYAAAHYDLALAYEGKMREAPASATEWCQKALAAWEEAYRLVPEDSGFTADAVVRIGKRVRELEKECPATSTPRSVPTATPTILPTWTTTACARGDAWRLYDDFTEPNAFTANWWLDDEHSLCKLDVQDGHLAFDCRNESTTDDYLADLHPARSPDNVIGIAATVQVERAGGPFQLVTIWLDTTDHSEWAYHLEAGADVVEAVKYDLKTGYEHPISLGEVSIQLGVPHVLHIEQAQGGLLFCVDGNQLAIDQMKNVSPPLKLNDWSFTYFVWQDDNSITGYIEKVDVKVGGE